MEGTLFIVGGGLIQSADEVFAELIRRAGGANGRFAFIVSASGMDPDDTFRSYRDDFVRLGAREETACLCRCMLPMCATSAATMPSPAMRKGYWS